jgi:lipoprotein
MKLKKLLALALAGVLMLALLTGCSGDGNGEDRLVAVGVADIFKRIYPNTEVSYGVPALTRTIRPAFTPDWFQNTPEGIIWLDGNFPIDAGQTLEGFLQDSLKAYAQSNFVSFVAFDSTGMSALQQVERFSSGAPVVRVYYKDVSPTVNTKLRVGVCHKTVAGREYCLVVIVRA